MKKSISFPLAFISLFAFFPTGCNNSGGDKKTAEAKTTDIPATTKSQEALAAFRQGQMLADLFEIKKAGALFSKAIQLDPKFGLAYLMRANTDFSAKEYADDVNMGKANLDSASDWEKMYADYLSTNLSDERNKGIGILEKIAASYPDAARAQVDLGNAYTGNNQFDKARQSYEKAIKLDSLWVGGYLGLANSYLFSEPKDLKRAEENALKIVALAPKSAGAEITLGDVYRAQNDFERAKDAYSKAVDLDKDVPEAYYKLGHANTYLGNFEEARKNYRDAGMRDGSAIASVLNTGYTYLYAGDSKAAKNYLFEELSKIDTSEASPGKMANDKNNLLTTIGFIAIHNGDAATLKKIIPGIHATFNQVARDIGNTAESKIFAVSDSLHWEAMFALAAGKYDEAIAKEEAMKAVTEPLKDDRKMEIYEADMGLINMKQKKYPDAIRHFEKADPNSIYYKFMLAKANEASGNKDKAMELYKGVSVYNFNGVENALVRNEAKKILGMP